jgi:elongation factor Ts
MSAVTTDMIKDVREKTGAGMMDCKKALVESNGDAEKAIAFLREKGLAKAAKRTGRETKEGRIISYIHGVGRIGVLLELNCETDFVAKNEDFESLGRDIAMHIAASNPLSITSEDLSQDEVAKEREIYVNQLKEEGKPENIIDKIVEGKIKKFYTEVCLLDQPYIKEPKISVGEYLKESISTFGENITVGKFVRYQIGG